MKNQRPYEILEVTSSSSQDEIKNSYRKLAKKYHPDLNPGNKEAEKKFKEISGAYELIGTAENRTKFDRGDFDEEVYRQTEARSKNQQSPFYHQTQQGGGRYSFSFGGMDPESLEAIFGQMGPMGNMRRNGSSGNLNDSPGQDVLYRMEVEFKDAVLGAEREITLPSGKRLRVKIPPGVDSGVKLRFSGYGSPGTGQASAGDAYVELQVRPSSLFKRTGSDLELELPISFHEALLGGDVKTPTLDGSVLLKIPPGVTTGTRLRITGKGIPHEGKNGDQYVILKVMTPPQVDSDLRQALESWSKRQPFDPRVGWIGSKGSEL